MLGVGQNIVVHSGIVIQRMYSTVGRKALRDKIRMRDINHRIILHAKIFKTITKRKNSNLANVKIDGNLPTFSFHFIVPRNKIVQRKWVG